MKSHDMIDENKVAKPRRVKGLPGPDCAEKHRNGLPSKETRCCFLILFAAANRSLCTGVLVEARVLLFFYFLWLERVLRMSNNFDLVGADEETSGTVNVAIRIRPLSQAEKDRGDVAAWEVSENRSKLNPSEKLKDQIAKEGSATPSHKRMGTRGGRRHGNTPARKRTVNPASTSRKIPAFKAGNVFDSSFKTTDLFESVGKPVVREAMRGINGTILAYGQTSSGKTHTMLGNQSTPGVILLSVIDIFRHINETPGRAFLLRVSMVEIYNEIVRDLLNPKATRLQVYHDKSRGVQIQGVKEEIVVSPDHVWQLLDTGFGNRAVGSTGLNAESSRSHTIFRLVIESRKAMDDAPSAKPSQKIKVRMSTLNIVDLAGSERTADAGTTGGRRTEGMNINKSLMTLGGVIRQLVNDPNGHIPYRNSQLTRILQGSLGGNAKTSIVCTIAPAHRHFEESRTTLAFAANANRVKSKTKVNEVDMRMSIMGAHESAMTKLRQQLQNFGISALATATNGATNPGGVEGQAVMNDSELVEAREKAAAEAKEAASLREQLQTQLDNLTQLVLTATSYDTTAGDSRHSDITQSARKRSRHKARQTWGPGDWVEEFKRPSSIPRRHFGTISGNPTSKTSKDQERTSNSSWTSASRFFDESDQLRSALDSMEEELDQTIGMLEGERQSRLEAESRAMKLDSELGLFMDGIGLEDKSMEELEQLEHVYMKGMQRILEARHVFTIEKQRREYEEELCAMKAKYDADIIAFKSENSKETDRLRESNERMKAELESVRTKLDETSSAKKDIAKRLQTTEGQYKEELQTIKQRSLQTEIELRSKVEEANNQTKSKTKESIGTKIDTIRTPLMDKTRASLINEKTAGPSPIQLLFEKARKQSLSTSSKTRTSILRP